MSADLAARVAELERQVAKLIAGQRRPVHHLDFSPKQREAVNAVAETTGVPWNQLAAEDRGPQPTSDARAILYEVLANHADMSDAQIGRLIGRTYDAVRKARQQMQPDLDDDDDGFVIIEDDTLLGRAGLIIDNLRAAQFAQPDDRETPWERGLHESR